MPVNRPSTFESFHGQAAAVEQLRVPVAACRRVNRVMGHVLLVGPAGTGKTTLGEYVLATELGIPPGSVRALNCAAIEQPAELLTVVTTVPPGGLLFMDEIHAVPKPLQDHLLSLLEDSSVTIVIGEGAQRDALRVEVERYTVVAATTREGLLSAPMRSRFKHVVRLSLYSDADMVDVLQWHAAAAGLKLTNGAATKLAPVCHGTARHAVGFIEACRDTLQAISDDTTVDAVTVTATLKRLRYSKNGLSHAEVELLRRLSQAPDQTAGLASLAAVLDEDDETVESVYEPHLLRSGLIERTPKGRRLTDQGRLALKEAQ